MAFVIVEFENNSTNDENEVRIVNSKWFTDHTRKKVYWPPDKPMSSCLLGMLMYSK